MRYVCDNDLHIHSTLSSCCRNPEQTPERILQYAKDFGLKTVCLTDHFWDSAVEGASNWYRPQDFAHISQARPLPQAEGIRFLFGCETDMDKYMTLGLSRELWDEFDFIVVPTTHLHMKGFTIAEEDDTPEGKARVWVERLDALLNMDLPFHKVGIAHLSSTLMERTSPEAHAHLLDLIDGDDMERLFRKAAQLGVGIELNSSSVNPAPAQQESVLRMFRIAKRCGCKFYCSSDAHSPAEMECAKEVFEKIVDWLELTEDDKFVI